ncbi:tyrosine-type recombinase/integrase [Luteococcus japonicus]|uniref:Phage integrase n=1 Tax=Luteococcus japonicus LSP_Lj1 TaxID=1255658 RepID=A0A1R4K5B9_9ACTN|nr:tyrosine-type recombinase/integrase [Luteococcus japonicus]SJN39446.1 Phage integrase [Luteococcus japonicus LSP_Lj1]
MTIPLEDLRASFERSLRAEGRAAGTLRLYRQSVDFFCAWLVADGQKPTLDNLNRGNIREWMADLDEKGMADNTRKTRFRGLYRFCEWLVDEDELDANPMKKMRTPTEKPKPVPIVSDDALKMLLTTCRGKDFAARRDLAIFRVLIDCGLRVGELCNMGHAPEVLNLDGQSALVHGKTGTRFVYLSDRTVQALDRYLRLRRGHRYASSEALWLGERGPMTPDGIRERFNVRTEQAGIEHIHPHQLRHTWAADFLAHGGQEREAMRLAGWSSDAMLSRYGSANADARAKATALRMKRGDRL